MSEHQSNHYKFIIYYKFIIFGALACLCELRQLSWSFKASQIPNESFALTCRSINYSKYCFSKHRGSQSVLLQKISSTTFSFSGSFNHAGNFKQHMASHSRTSESQVTTTMISRDKKQRKIKFKEGNLKLQMMGYVAISALAVKSCAFKILLTLCTTWYKVGLLGSSPIYLGMSSLLLPL